MVGQHTNSPYCSMAFYTVVWKLVLTQTKIDFAQDLLYAFTVILPSITRTLDNSLHIIFFLVLPLITRTSFIKA